MADSSFYFRNLTAQCGDAQLRAYWQQLADTSPSAEAIYQTPAFFDFLCTTAHAGQTPYLYGAYQHGQAQLQSLIPLQHQRRTSAAARWQLPEQLVILGSGALMPRQAGSLTRPIQTANCTLLHALHAFLLEEFEHAQAFVYRALPASDPVWQALQQERSTLLPLHLHGWRDCHYMDLPANYACYLTQLGAKRRYNLKRQQRLLSEQAGAALRVLSIERTEQLAALHQALAVCCLPAQRTQLWDCAELQALAQHGLLLCYRMDAGSRPCGVVLGLQMNGVYHLFNILADPRWQALSAGTTLLQLALADLCDQRHCQRLEFGYGSPAHAHQSGNQTSRRSHLLLMRRNWCNQLRCLVQTMQTGVRAFGGRYRQSIH